jgi:hypothetical protein
MLCVFSAPVCTQKLYETKDNQRFEEVFKLLLLLGRGLETIKQKRRLGSVLYLKRKVNKRFEI